MYGKGIEGKTRYALNQIIVKDDYRYLVNKATGKIVERLRSYGVFVGEEHERLIRELCSVVTNQWREENRIVVHPGVCGFGKTTAIIELVKILADAFPEMGIVIAVERVADMLRMENELDGRAIPYFSFHADLCLQRLSKYDPRACRECPHFCRKKQARKEHEDYQVLIISHERLRMRALYGEDLGELAYFVDRNGNKRKRSLMLIDEKPQITMNQCLSRNDLSKLREFLIKVDPESPLYSEAKLLEGYIHHINLKVSELNDDYIIADPIDASFQLSDEMKGYFFQAYEGEDFAVLGLLVSFICKGGIVQFTSYRKNQPIPEKIFTADILHPDFDMKIVIFDATATVDRDYQGKRYLILDAPQIRDFSNLTINEHRNINLSRTKLLSNEKPIDPRALLTDVLTDFSGEMLLLTYKDRVGEFRAILDEWQDNNFNCNVNYYGNIKGDNQYANAERVLLYGLNHKADAYYAAKALSHGIRTEFGTYPFTKIDGRVYQDERLQEIFESEMAADLIQCIMRTKLRKHTKEPVEVYCFIQSNRLMCVLQEYFCGCLTQDWHPFAFCVKHQNNNTRNGQRISELLAYLEKKFGTAEIGTSVEKQVIQRELTTCNGKNTLGTDLKNDLVRIALKRLGVYVGHHKLIKNERGWSHDKDNTNQKQVC